MGKTRTAGIVGLLACGGVVACSSSSAPTSASSSSAATSSTPSSSTPSSSSVTSSSPSSSTPSSSSVTSSSPSSSPPSSTLSSSTSSSTASTASSLATTSSPGGGECPLSISGEHYGKTYAEWASAWWAWYYDFPFGPTCRNPALDPTGAFCALGQDPSGPVFFLAGDTGGTAIRDACKVPAGKALFVPFINFEDDNVDTTPPVTQSEMVEDVQMYFADVDVSKLSLEVDGTACPGVSALAVPPTVFSYRAAPLQDAGADAAPSDAWTCLGFGAPFSGPVSPAAQGGYYFLLAPLAPGPHTIHFTSAAPSVHDTQSVTYNLVVEESDGG